MQTIVVIGGGFSGTLTACHLLQRRDIRVVMVESNGSVGRGMAYAASARDLLLNVPAGSMSAWTDRPNDFVLWLQQRDPSADALTFAPRSVYGDYIADLLRRSRADDALHVIRAEAVDVERRDEQYAVRLSSGGVVCCCRVILALGHARPRPLSTNDHVDVWSARVIQHPLANLHALTPKATDTVAVVGTGLTAVDVVTTLRRRQHRGRIVAISRRGLTPQVQAWPVPSTLPPVPEDVLQHPTVTRLVKWLKQVGRELSTIGVPPVRAVDALRPYAAELWQRMPPTERARFFRHACGFWNACRHRAAPASHAPLAGGRADGSIEVLAARYIGYEAIDEDRVLLSIQRRGHSVPSAMAVDWLVNCTGPDRDLRRHPSALVQSLLRKRMLQPDPLALGAMVTPQGELIDACGDVVAGTYVVGPWRAADLWESTAVPDLRVQITSVAEHVAASLERETSLPSVRTHGPLASKRDILPDQSMTPASP